MFKISGWADFQHYKDRNPPWIKLHKSLMTNYKWHMLHNDSKVLALNLWMLASEYKDPMAGLVTDNFKEIAFIVRMDEKRVVECVKELIENDFITHDSNMLSECYQLAVPEERRGESEKSQRRVREEESVLEKNLKDLSIDDISEWLEKKRACGKYLIIDEHAQLEYFKNYCIANGRDKGKKAYKNFISAFQNSFEWENVKKKGSEYDGLSRKERLDLAGKRGIAKAMAMEGYTDRGTSEPELCDIQRLRQIT